MTTATDRFGRPFCNECGRPVRCRVGRARDLPTCSVHLRVEF